LKILPCLDESEKGMKRVYLRFFIIKIKDAPLKVKRHTVENSK
jgi:hypothetical protein